MARALIIGPETGARMALMSRLPQRVVDKIAIDPATGCWLWTAALSRLGYGRVGWDRKARPAHRVIYELLRGTIAAGLELDHLCRIRRCVNPDHLEPVAHAENVRRADNGHWHRQKTHCPQGHPYEGDNLRFSPTGFRYCLMCKRIKVAEWRRSRRAAARAAT